MSGANLQSQYSTAPLQSLAAGYSPMAAVQNMYRAAPVQIQNPFFGGAIPLDFGIPQQSYASPLVNFRPMAFDYYENLGKPPKGSVQEFLQSSPAMTGNGQAMWGIPGTEGSFRDALTAEQIMQSGQVPTEGEWVQAISGGDGGQTGYIPYNTYWNSGHGGA